ncbi:MAG TPA: SH3 domain-containing protein [Syntrophomonadaceae bacterium]|nr:SH3 domain-containing protein [Syntrophomonadaceae bacterium]
MRRRQVKIIALICIFTLIFPLAAMADTGTITGSVLNVRSGPGTEYPVIGSLYQDTQVEVLDSQNGWYQIQYRTLKGWVSGNYIDVKKSTQLRVTGSSVNLRSGPGTDYPVLGSVKQGDLLVLVAAGDQWHQVKTTAGTTAYISAQYVEPVNGSVTPKPEPKPEPAPTPQPTPGKVAPPKILLNGEPMTFGDVEPVVDQQRTLVPLRAIFEAMGATVTWDQAKQQAVAVRGDTRVVMPLNSTSPTVNGKVQKIDVPAKVVNQRILAPLRFVGEAFGGKVVWHQASYTVDITLEDLAPPEPERDKITLSTARDSNAVRAIIQGTAPLNAVRKTGPGELSLSFKDMNIEGSSAVSVDVGAGKTMKVVGSNQGDDAVIKVTLPEKIRYEVWEEDNGKRLIINVPNLVVSVSQANFSSSSEKIVVQTLLPANYGHQSTDRQFDFRLQGVNPGHAQNEYTFRGGELVERVLVKGVGPDTIVTVLTTEPSRFVTSTSGNKTEINVLAISSNPNPPPVPPIDGKLVVLDPGHGGSESGASYAGIYEKDITLDIALRTGKILQSRGIPVIYTRDSDVYVSLGERGRIANAANATCFVSIHCNAFTQPSAHGIETWFWAPSHTPRLYEQRQQRQALASALQNQLVADLQRANRGVKEGNLQVLRDTNMPSALVEVMFLSNPEERSMLVSDYYKQVAAQAIADGIINYLQNNP